MSPVEKVPPLPEDYLRTLERLNMLWQTRSPEYAPMLDQYSHWAQPEAEDDLERAEKHPDWSNNNFGRLMHEHNELKESEMP